MVTYPHRVMRGEALRRIVLAVSCCVLASCGGHGNSALVPPQSSGNRAHADVSTTYSAIVLGDGATAYYRLDDTSTTAADSGPNQLNGTVGASVKESVAGLVAGGDTAMQFPG